MNKWVKYNIWDESDNVLSAKFIAAYLYYIQMLHLYEHAVFDLFSFWILSPAVYK